MKTLLTAFIILTGQIVIGQSYDDQINKAAEALQKKDFCNALAIFKTAFEDSAKIGTYDFAYAALAATQCNAEKLALTWLKKSQVKGLGMNPGEIDAISSDSGFVKLHRFAEWTVLIGNMKTVMVQKQALQTQKTDSWMRMIDSNKLSKRENKKFSSPKSGFALYHTKVDTLKIPYLVYVPQSYNASKPMQAVVYLHGGIVSTEGFNFDNPDLATGEPIFSVGDAFNSIIIYPFGKKDFGWVAQKRAFENVLTIIDSAQQHYNIDKQRIFMGGMSNGGTATFWFASQKPNRFKGFYAFSALPKLEVGDINFRNLSQGKSFYTINSKEDDVFRYNDVLSIYKEHKIESKDWTFNTLEKGSHGFIYDSTTGKQVIHDLFGKLLSK